MFSQDERTHMVLALMSSLPYLEVCRIGLELESVGYYENNPSLNAIFQMTEQAAERMSMCRVPKADYKVPFQIAIQSVLAQETMLRTLAAQEATARRKVVEIALSGLDLKTLAAFHTGLLAGKVVTNQVPQILAPVFKTVSNVHSDAEEAYKALILEVLSKKIVES